MSSKRACRVSKSYYYSVIGNKQVCGYPHRLCDPDPGEMGKECLRCERVSAGDIKSIAASIATITAKDAINAARKLDTLIYKEVVLVDGSDKDVKGIAGEFDNIK